MSTDYRAELQRLVKAYDEHGGRWPDEDVQALFQAVKAARTALAQPEPEGPTEKQVMDLADDCAFDRQEISGFDGGRTFHGHGWECTDDQLVTFATELLTRCARPTIEPVPVSERPWEREGWCDEYGMCWRFDPCDRGWWSYGPILPSDGDPAPFTHWLPHHALPIPTP
jgi:hypothetical protein